MKEREREKTGFMILFLFSYFPFFLYHMSFVFKVKSRKTSWNFCTYIIHST